MVFINKNSKSKLHKMGGIFEDAFAFLMVSGVNALQVIKTII